MPRRHFPAPWTVTDTGSSWQVSDANQFAIVWFCYDERPKEIILGDRMTRAEAYAMAVNFARLPELLGKG